MIVFAHVGMPKTLSTALQKCYFALNPQVYYLGIGVDGEIGYIDSDVERIFEHLTLYTRDEVFFEELEFAQGILRKHRAKADKMSKRAFGVSLEWLGFRFTPDMAERERIAERLRLLFGEELQILLVLRRQDQLLSSLYNEYVKVGLPQSWREFVSYIYQFRERNFYSDLCFSRVVESYQKITGADKLRVFFLENYLEERGKLSLGPHGIPKILIAMDDALGLDQGTLSSLSHQNPSLSSAVLAQKLALNKRFAHDFGNSIFNHSALHRQRVIHEKERPLIQTDIYRDVRVKRMLLAEAEMRVREATTDLSPIHVDSADPVYKWLLESFEESNTALLARYGNKVPEEYLTFRL